MTAVVTTVTATQIVILFPKPNQIFFSPYMLQSKWRAGQLALLRLFVGFVATFLWPGATIRQIRTCWSFFLFPSSNMHQWVETLSESRGACGYHGLYMWYIRQQVNIVSSRSVCVRRRKRNGQTEGFDWLNATNTDGVQAAPCGPIQHTAHSVGMITCPKT